MAAGGGGGGGGGRREARAHLLVVREGLVEFDKRLVQPVL